MSENDKTQKHWPVLARDGILGCEIAGICSISQWKAWAKPLDNGKKSINKCQNEFFQKLNKICFCNPNPNPFTVILSPLWFRIIWIQQKGAGRASLDNIGRMHLWCFQSPLLSICQPEMVAYWSHVLCSELFCWGLTPGSLPLYSESQHGTVFVLL